MPGDYSRKTFNRSKHYSGVLMQQGRVQLEFGRIRKSPLRAVSGLLSHFPDWAYLSAKTLARRMGLRGRS